LNARRLLAGALALTVLIALAPASVRAGGPQLIIARVKDAVGLDPAHETDGLSLDVTSEVLQGLVAFRPGTFDIVPALASSWRSTPGGRRWTFVLQRGLRFSDGTPVDAAAVKFNFDRWRLTNDPYHGAGIYPYYEDVFGGFPGRIVDVRAEGPGQVTLVLSQPYGPLLRALAMPSFAIGSPKAIKADARAYALRPVGSGPYTVAEWVKDDHITLAANPLYAGPKPLYGTVILRDIPDQATSILSVQKGEVDGLTDPRPDDAKALARMRGVRIYHEPSNNVAYLALNMDRKPFDRVEVRRAVAYALDLQAIAQGLYGAGAVVETFSPLACSATIPRCGPTRTTSRARKRCSRRPASRTASPPNSTTARPRGRICPSRSALRRRSPRSCTMRESRSRCSPSSGASTWPRSATASTRCV
jgi:peptide/nickel transport system substrate-binding protein